MVVFGDGEMMEYNFERKHYSSLSSSIVFLKLLVWVNTLAWVFILAWFPVESYMTGYTISVKEILTMCAVFWAAFAFHMVALGVIEVFKAIRDSAINTKQCTEDISRLIGAVEPHLEYYTEVAKWFVDERE